MPGGFGGGSVHLGGTAAAHATPPQPAWHPHAATAAPPGAVSTQRPWPWQRDAAQVAGSCTTPRAAGPSVA
jgi:hypothetical protein